MATTHGLSYTKEYRAWSSLKHRCLNPNDPAFKHYGGRGIKVCERWIESVVAFIQDMGLAPSPKHSIDRIDPNGDYCPENCRWATAKQQSNNKRPEFHRYFTAFGKKQSVSEWADEYRVEVGLVLFRLELGWEFERALTIPPRPRTRAGCRRWAKLYGKPFSEWRMVNGQARRRKEAAIAAAKKLAEAPVNPEASAPALLEATGS